jgi:hypothetical protein
MIASAVQHHLVNTGDPPDFLPWPENVEKVVSYAVGADLIVIKVYTTDQNVRTWNLRLIEQKGRAHDDKS